MQTYLHDGLLDADADTLAVHALASIANKTELKVDTNLLAGTLGKLRNV